MNVLLTSKSFIPSVLLCASAQLTELKRSGKLDFRFVTTLGLNNSNMNWADIIIFVRAFSDYELICMKNANASGKATVYVLDDNLPDIPDSLCDNTQYSQHNRKNIIEMIKECSAFLSPSRNLISLYGPMAHSAYMIEEPALGTKEKKANDVVKIGFAGNMDKTGDINSILGKTIRYLVNKYEDRIEVEFFGARPGIVDDLGLGYIPYTRSYEDYQEKMGELNWDIGLAPMAETEFSRYKHYNKLIEYSSYGIAGVYTDCEPYTFAVVNRENGILCNNNTEAWTSAIEELINNADLRNRISQRCIHDAENKYSLGTCADEFFKILSELSYKRDRKVKNAGPEHFKYIATYMHSSFKKYGFKIISETLSRGKANR